MAGRWRASRAQLIFHCRSTKYLHHEDRSLLDVIFDVHRFYQTDFSCQQSEENQIETGEIFYREFTVQHSFRVFVGRVRLWGRQTLRLPRTLSATKSFEERSRQIRHFGSSDIRLLPVCFRTRLLVFGVNFHRHRIDQCHLCIHQHQCDYTEHQRFNDGSGCDNQHLHHFHSSYAVYLNFDLDNDNYHRLCYHILWKAQEMGRRWSFERLFFCIEHILSCIKLNYLFNLQILHSAVKPGQKTKMRRHGPILSSRPGSTGPLRRPN